MKYFPVIVALAVVASRGLRDGLRIQGAEDRPTACAWRRSGGGDASARRFCRLYPAGSGDDDCLHHALRIRGRAKRGQIPRFALNGISFSI